MLTIYRITSSLLILVCFYLMHVPSVEAQNAPFTCGTKFTAKDLEYIGSRIIPFEKNRSKKLRTTNTVYVPIKYHIVRKSDGSGGPFSMSYLTSGIQYMNNAYAPINVQFYIYETPDEVYSDELYDYDNQVDPSITAAFPVTSNAINVYLTNTVKNGGNIVAGYAWFGGSIVMSHQYMVGSVFDHEMGHHYGLGHTHGNSNTPGTTQELVNGSNCATTGDRICDTPADPNRWLSGCKIDGMPRDANGDLYQPNGDNIMSYSKGCADNFFSQGQYNRMATAHDGEKDNQDIRTHAGPTITSIAPEITSPGATITITGTGFSATPSENIVTIGRKPATVISASSTQLVVVVANDARLGKEGIGVEVNKQYTVGGALTLYHGIYPYSESFENGWGYWVEPFSLTVGWRRNSGGTPTANTGPSSAADGNYYIYADADDHQTTGWGLFESGWFNLSTLPNPEITFSYHAYGSTIDSCLLEVTILGDNSGERHFVWKVKGDQGNTWHQTKVNLSVFAGKTISFKFYSINSKTSIADFAIDNIQIANASTFYISNFTPSQGPVGAIITINGAGFSATPANNLVKFNGTVATVSAATATSLTVTVPQGATTGKVSVEVGGETATSVGDFTVLSSDPTITGFTPTFGTEGTEVTIQGYNFDPTIANNVVKFNGTTANVTSAFANELKATVPTGATTGKITVETGGKTATSDNDFVVTNSSTDPVITGFTPKSGVVGTEVTITGVNFDATAINNTVDFNGTTATVKSASVTQLTVDVPTGATSGRISVNVGGLTATSTQNFVVLTNATDPAIIDFTPKSGSADTQVTINGVNFDATPENNIVKFNGSTATVQSATATELKALVPADATTGKISVEVGSFTATSLDDFTVIGTGITAFNIKPAKVITPNGDQVNDTWTIGGIQGLDSYQIRIFSKAGQVVYSSSDYTTPWDGTRDGKALPPGIYYYNIMMSARGVKERKTGYVALIK